MLTENTRTSTLCPLPRYNILAPTRNVPPGKYKPADRPAGVFALAAYFFADARVPLEIRLASEDRPLAIAFPMVEIYDIENLRS